MNKGKSKVASAMIVFRRSDRATRTLILNEENTEDFRALLEAISQCGIQIREGLPILTVDSFGVWMDHQR